MTYFQIRVTPISNGSVRAADARYFCFYAANQDEANDKAFDYAYTLSEFHSIDWLNEIGRSLGTRLPHGLYDQLSQSRYRNDEGC